ncbi:MAG TPA: low molecular weight phosphatase family protein [Actinomycetota bacterium]
MTSILLVCTGNVCRSPMAEGFVRAALERRLGDDAPAVSSAGTAGWEGSGATPEAVRAARERGVAIDRHVARRLQPAYVRDADLVVAMAGEHRDAIAAAHPELADRTFTLKELVRILEAMPDGEEATASLEARVAAAADARRAGVRGNALDEDVVDPLGMPFEGYRAIAWELQEWSDRLAEALVGPAPVPARPDLGGEGA